MQAPMLVHNVNIRPGIELGNGKVAVVWCGYNENGACRPGAAAAVLLEWFTQSISS